MSERIVVKTVQGHRTVDGAGVNLVRVLGNKDVRDFDPFLMLDSFDSTNPDDYTKGFPTHPHRGIETITYLIEGEIEHQDSLGNEGVIRNGESQWMTAGSGILHQEMPKASQRMLGLQIWLNLPRQEKMVPPAYFDITKDMVKVITEDFGTVRVISGKYKETQGVQAPHWPATMYDITLESGKEAVLKTNPDETVFVFLIVGDGQIGGETYAEKTAVLFGDGESIRIRAQEECRFFYFSGKPLKEPVVWGGPIVMNTREELQTAFDELDTGDFIKHNAKQ